MSQDIAIHLGRSSSVDDKLVKYALEQLSPEEVSRRLDGVISPARVLLRTKEILSAKDWLTAAEKEQALLRTMGKNLTLLQDNLSVGGMGVDKDLMKLALDYIKEIKSTLRSRGADIEAKVDTYNANVGKQIGQVVDIALSYMKGALRDEIDADRWDDLLQEAMLVARNKIAEREEVEA